MNTATLEKPETRELALAVHEFNAEGICHAPEVVTVKMPKGSTCEIRLAADAGDGWYIGYRLAVGKEPGLDVFPQIGAGVKHNRATALEAGLVDAVNYFEASPKSKAHKQCANAVHAFMAGAAGNSSPANNPAKGKIEPLPEPQNLDLPVARLEENPHNPRGEIKPEDVEELVETIKSQGLLQPIGVRILVAAGGLPGIGEDNRLELLWGHRRLAAFRSLKRDRIPCRVYEGITDEQARLVISIENDERQDLDPIKRAKGYAAMMTDFEMTQDDVAGALKKSRPVIANSIRLLELPAVPQDLLAVGKLTTAHGTALCRFKDWPEICTKIAELTVKNKVSAAALEKGLPFHEELEDAKLVVSFSWFSRRKIFEKLKKERPDDCMEWKQGYETMAYCLVYHVANDLLEAARKEEETQQEAARGRTDSGEMTPAAKRERQKKLDVNLTNRLQVTAMEHVALQRVSMVTQIDDTALLVVAREAMSHCGGVIIEEVAKRIGITLPKDFEEDTYSDSKFAALLKVKPADLLCLAAAALACRDAAGAMRFAGEVPPFVEMLARSKPSEALDAPSYVAQWREKILPLVKAGSRAEQIQGALDCPEFIAVQLTREIRRELRDGSVPILTPDESALIGNMPAPALAHFRRLLHDQGDKTDGQLAKEFADSKTAKAELAAVRNLIAQEIAWDKTLEPAAVPVEEKPKPKGKGKAAKKAKKKAAPAKAKAKKGAKKK